MRQEFLNVLDRLLVAEKFFVEALKNSRAAARLSAERKKLLNHLRTLRQSDDLPLIIETEKKIIQGDLSRYANSAAMTSSLKAAMEAMQVIEDHIALVNSKETYRIINRGHSMAQNRKAGLPFDEARQALASHHTRLANLDKSRLDEDEKQIIEARKALIGHAIDCYARRQIHILGLA